MMINAHKISVRRPPPKGRETGKFGRRYDWYITTDLSGWRITIQTVFKWLSIVVTIISKSITLPSFTQHPVSECAFGMLISAIWRQRDVIFIRVTDGRTSQVTSEFLVGECYVFVWHFHVIMSPVVTPDTCPSTVTKGDNVKKVMYIVAKRIYLNKRQSMCPSMNSFINMLLGLCYCGLLRHNGSRQQHVSAMSRK